MVLRDQISSRAAFALAHTLNAAKTAMKSISGRITGAICLRRMATTAIRTKKHAAISMLSGRQRQQSAHPMDPIQSHRAAGLLSRTARMQLTDASSVGLATSRKARCDIECA